MVFGHLGRGPGHTPMPILMWLHAALSGGMGCVMLFMALPKVWRDGHGYDRLMIIPFGIFAAVFGYVAFAFSVMALDEMQELRRKRNPNGDLTDRR